MSVPFLDAARDGNSQMHKLPDCASNDVAIMENGHETNPCTHARRNVFTIEPFVQNMPRMLHTTLEEGPVSLLHLWICIVLSSVTSLSSVI